MKEYEYYKTRKPIKGIDIVLLLFLFVSFFIGIFFVLPTNGNSATITVEGKVYGTFLLSENRIIALKNMDIVIENSEIYVKNSNCHNKTCEKQGKINSANQVIVCVPNRVIIVVNGAEKTDAIIGGTI